MNRIRNICNHAHIHSAVKIGLIILVLGSLSVGWESGSSGKSMMVRNGFSLALKTDGTLWAWGSNDYGQLGDGTAGYRNDGGRSKVETGWGCNRRTVTRITSDTDYLVDNYKNIPTKVGTDSDWLVVSAGIDYATALKTDGTLWAWGSNEYGQLGDGTSGFANFKATPTRIGIDNWSIIATYFVNTLGLKTDGTLWTCGYVPTQITGTGWSAIAVGGSHSLALKTDGTLWAWGVNWYGQLGDGTTTDRLTPTLIGTGFSACAAGVWHTVALKADGSLYAWGRNDYGQLGDGTTAYKNTPTLIGTGFSACAAGDYHTIALKTDGTLWAWGNNDYGQLGDGTTISRTSPTRIGSDTDWSAIATSKRHTIALKTDGTLYAWGYNGQGQLGDGTYTQRLTPTQIGTDTNWSKISTR